MDESLREIVKLIESEQYDYAIFLLTNYIELNKQCPDAFLKRGVCYMKKYFYRDAILNFDKAIEIDRTLTSAYVKKSKCYLAIGDLENAINSMVFLSQIPDYETFARNELEKLRTLKEQSKKADKLYEEHKYDKVVEIMTQCLETADICVRFNLLRAECLIYLGRHEEVVRIINDILFVNKDDVDAICIQAQNLMYQCKYKIGLAELREVFTKSPKAKKLYNTYRQICEYVEQANRAFDQENYVKAETLYEKVLKLDSKNKMKNKQVYLKLAQVYLRRKEYDKCIVACCDILDNETNHVKALEFRAKCNFEMGDYELAAEDYIKILTIDRNNHYIKINLENAQRKAGIDNDYYGILGISQTATIQDIKKAFQALALKYHPDKAEVPIPYYKKKYNLKFHKINKAKEELLKRHTK